MKSLAIFLLFCVFGTQANLFCYEDVKNQCSSNQYTPVCSTLYGNFPNVVSKFQQYINTHLARSMQALMIAKQFSTYQKARNGFHDLFLDFSNTLFEQAIDLIRYTTNRGGKHDFGNYISHDETHGNYELGELESLTWILDAEKRIAQDALDIDSFVGGTHPNYHDGDGSNYLASTYAYRHRKNVRAFAKYYVKLEKMLTSKNQMIALFDIDNVLQDEYGYDD